MTNVQRTEDIGEVGTHLRTPGVHWLQTVPCHTIVPTGQSFRISSHAHHMLIPTDGSEDADIELSTLVNSANLHSHGSHSPEIPSRDEIYALVCQIKEKKGLPTPLPRASRAMKLKKLSYIQFYSFPIQHQFLSLSLCQQLIDLIDERVLQACKINNTARDFKLILTGEELQSIVGEQNLRNMLTVLLQANKELHTMSTSLYGPLLGTHDTHAQMKLEIKLRRIVAKPEVSNLSTSISTNDIARSCIKFHTDFAACTMQIPLNGDTQYTGGRLVFATDDGGWHVPSRPAGSATVHNDQVVHGVTAFYTGIRYSLFLLLKHAHA